MNRGYDSFSELDLERLFFTYDEIIKEAGDRQVTIFVIPREYEIDLDEDTSVGHEITKRLKEFASTRPTLKIVDLLPEFVNYARKHGLENDAFFHSCDGHWNQLGHQLVANILLENLF